MTNVQNEPTGRETYRAAIGADGCGCPITAELTTANGSEVEGTQRTEHRPKCWAAEPIGYAVTAAELRRIADAIEDLPGAPSHVSIDFQAAPVNGTDEEIAAGVDAVAMAVLGRPGKDRGLSGGKSQRHAGEWTNQGGSQTFAVSIYQMYVQPDPKDVEIERLRADLAVARAATETAKSYLGTEGAVSQAKPDTMLREYTGRATPMVTRYFSFGHGQTDPDTGESLLDKYATVVASSVEACREAMFASRYGNRWSFDYAPDDPQWLEWGPRWTEHERIVVGRVVPDVQTRPECSPECEAGVSHARPGHLDDCPVFVAEQSGGE
jgi:hypothetical protein